MKKRSRRGFTLVEMVVVLVVAAVLMSIGVPALTGVLRGGEHRRTTRKLAGDLRFARTQAISGTLFSDGSGGPSLRKTRFTALRLDSDKQYSVVMDDNMDPNDGETVLRVVQIPADNPVSLYFTSTIRVYFTAQGTLAPGSPTELRVLRDGRTLAVRANGSGQVSINPL